MNFKYLGRKELRVSEICLGTMTFGEQVEERESHRIMDVAWDLGVNFYDTAEMYSVPGRQETQGRSEEILGAWIKKRQRRAGLILATKITGPSTGLSYIRNPLNFSRNQIFEAVEGSLRRLKTDYIDIYQLHWPERKVNSFGKRGFIFDPEDPWEDNFISILQTMQELKENGKIRYFGISNETPWGLMHIMELAGKHNLIRPVSIQNPYNLLNRTYEIGLAEVSIREDVPLLAYSPMAFGLLSGKYDNGDPGADARLNKFSVLSRYNSPNAREAAKRYNTLAKEYSISPAQLSLAFVNRQVFVGSNIIGVTSEVQLRENISSTKVKLSAELLKELESIHELYPDPAP